MDSVFWGRIKRLLKLSALTMRGFWILVLLGVVFGAFTTGTDAAGSGSRGSPSDLTFSEEPDDIGDYDDGTEMSGKGSSGPPSRVFRLWPNGVVKYKISPSIESGEVAKLKSSMATLSRKTCIRFTEASAGEMSGYVSIIPGLKCSSMLGKQEGVSTLMLSIKKCFGNGTLARNFMRVLGFTFENNRADRDNYIQINWDNISEANKKKFTKLSAEDYPVTNLPYDYQSVTHYTKTAWARSRNSWTIKAKKNSDQVLGNSRGYSDGDFAKINSLYKCR